MEVIVHYPKDEEGMAALMKKVSSVHAKAIENYLKDLTCPQDQKLQLIKTLQSQVIRKS